ncbi:uncharacterized protein LOC141906252 [Tubulanus polymorphus]|uniref:uncharacterized protein LOC141906252 n=1 Tax=Tubulanus polymorphus TaxID=672921 RepID=UPI003DA3A5F6
MVLLKAKGRLDNASLEDCAKHPIVLHPKNAFTKLIVTDLRANPVHKNLACTMVKVRENYWVPTLRQLAKNIINECVPCNRADGRPYAKPVPAPLPEFRVQLTPPFTTTGIDFSGAVTVRKSDIVNTEQAYIGLFTCAVTRFIHLELVPVMSVPTFL